MIGELASAIPADGGSISGAARARPFWGYQEAGFRSASVFDRPSILPSSFCYLGKYQPALTDGWRGTYGRCAGGPLLFMNLRGAPAVGEVQVCVSSCCLRPSRSLLFLAVALVRAAPGGAMEPASFRGRLATAIAVAMWNYMGWDNASTVAQEVENPQRNYPRAMIAATVLVRVTYIVPMAFMRCRTLFVGFFYRRLGACGNFGRRSAAGIAVVAGGAITGIGMFMHWSWL